METRTFKALIKLLFLWCTVRSGICNKYGKKYQERSILHFLTYFFSFQVNLRLTCNFFPVPHLSATPFHSGIESKCWYSKRLRFENWLTLVNVADFFWFFPRRKISGIYSSITMILGQLPPTPKLTLSQTLILTEG